MAVGGGPFPNNEGLVFGIDTGYPVFSNNINTRFNQGRPTTNLLSGEGFSTYNNRGSDVTSVLESTTETFQGAPVIKQTLTPITSTGVSYLSGGNNPGIGVVTSGGGGIGGQYTGHSVFFKPTVPMHGSPIYTHYSNISGWQTCCNYEYVGDGWYRAYVIWYDSVTRADGKYWAINPQSAALNQPIVIYWAGPFKEALNSTTVSPYVFSSRGVDTSLIDLKRNSTVDVGNISFDSTNMPFFDGTDDKIDIASNLGVLNAYTFEYVVYTTVANKMPVAHRQNTSFYKYGANSWFYTHGGVAAEFYHTTGTSNGWSHWIVSYDGANIRIYQNASSLGTRASTGTADFTGGIRIGSWTSSASYTWNGLIPVMKMYNRALSDQEIQQNFQTYKTRFGI